MSTDKIKLNLSFPNQKVANRNYNPMTLEKAIELIKSKSYQEFIETHLIELLKKQPKNTYERFFKNISSHLNKIERKNNG